MRLQPEGGRGNKNNNNTQTGLARLYQMYEIVVFNLK